MLAIPGRDRMIAANGTVELGLADRIIPDDPRA